MTRLSRRAPSSLDTRLVHCLRALTVFAVACGTELSCPDGSVPSDGRCVDADAGTLLHDAAIFDGGQACSESILDCDGDASNACETDTSSDWNHCGACNRVCPWGCVDATCVPPRQLATTPGGTCAILASNEVTCWGSDTNGSLGLGIGEETSRYFVLTPSFLPGLDGAPRLTGVEELTPGGSFNAGFCARLSSGRVACWGHRRIDDGSSELQEVGTPTLLTELEDAGDFVAVGVGAMCALTGPERALVCFGTSFDSPRGPYSSELSPVLDQSGAAIAGATELTGGSAYACFRGSDVRCWGSNAGYALGTGTDSEVPTETPTPVLGIGGTGTLVEVTSLVSSHDHSCALTEGATVACWGAGSNRHYLGVGDVADDVAWPVQVLDTSGEPESHLTGAVDLGSGTGVTCALRDDSSVVCWGDNRRGQVGNGEVEGVQPFPAAVLGLDGKGALNGVVNISTGRGVHVCAGLRDGTVVCWGDNRSAALGSGVASAPIPYPVRVVPPPH